jgi:hypothetical protein
VTVCMLAARPAGAMWSHFETERESLAKEHSGRDQTGACEIGR